MPGNKRKTGGKPKNGMTCAKKAATGKKASTPKTAALSGPCICLKVHLQGPNRLVAACDGDILGCSFKGDGVRLDVSKLFYFDEMVDGETFLRFLRTATMANLVGKHVVELAVGAGYINKDCVLLVQNVPHAQMLTNI